MPSSTACCAMPEAPGVTLCARFRSCAAAGDVARLICNRAGEGWGAAPDRWVGNGGMGAGEDRGLTVGCCVGAGWVPLPPEEPLCLFAARLAWGEEPSVTRVPHRSTHGCPWGGVPYLLDGGQALELGTGEVLLLECGRLQHQVLLLRRVHLLQVLRCRVGLPVQRLLDHLFVGCKHVPRLHRNPKTPPPDFQPPTPCQNIIPGRFGGRGCRCRQRSGERAGGRCRCCWVSWRCRRHCWRAEVPGAARSPWRFAGELRGGGGQARAGAGGGGERVRGGTPWHPKLAPNVSSEARSRKTAAVTLPSPDMEEEEDGRMEEGRREAPWFTLPRQRGAPLGRRGPAPPSCPGC